MTLNGAAAIAGIGETPYSRSATESALELQLRPHSSQSKTPGCGRETSTG